MFLSHRYCGFDSGQCEGTVLPARRAKLIGNPCRDFLGIGLCQIFKCGKSHFLESLNYFGAYAFNGQEECFFLCAKWHIIFPRIVMNSPTDQSFTPVNPEGDGFLLLIACERGVASRKLRVKEDT